MLLGLDHVQLAMPAGKEAEARAFYAGLLKLEEIPKPEKLLARGGVWFILPDGRHLHLGVENPFVPAKKAHPAFVADVQALAKHLEADGVQIQWDDLIPGVQRFYATDPFGNRLEFLSKLVL